MNNKLETKHWFAFRNTFLQTESNCLTLFRMGFFGAAHGWGGQKGLPFLKSVTYILQ